MSDKLAKLLATVLVFIFGLAALKVLILIVLWTFKGIGI